MFLTHQFDQSSVMVAVADFVDTVLNLGIGYTEFTQQLAKLIPAFIAFDEEGLSYVPSIDTFKIMCEYIDQRRLDRGLEEYLSSLSQEDYRHCKHILISDRHLHLRHIEQFQKQEKTNNTNLMKYVQNIIAEHYKVLVVRVDLGYKKEFLSEIKVTTFFGHINSLQHAMKDRNRWFRDLLGYGIALEQGESRGYHAHVFFIYNGSKRCKDWHLANSALQHWENITQGKGCGMNLNTPEYKKKFEKNGKLGIGMIHRKNEIEVQNALITISYLASQNKFNQHLRVKPMGKRTFYKGI